MISTYINYLLYSRDIGSSLDRVAREPTVSRDAKYYRENIGSVKTADDFVNNYRLFSYAMKAYGLEDMTYAKAFMKKVLESDLTDTKSFANKLTDERYRDFAAAFNFGPNAAAASQADAQSDAQEADTIGLYSRASAGAVDQVAADTAYFEDTVDTVTSVDDFLADDKLVTFALKAFNIDTRYYSTDALKKTLTSDMSDPASYANQVGNNAYKALANAFNFQADGSLAAGTPALDPDNKALVIEAYSYSAIDRVTPAAAQYNTDYFNANIGSVTNVSDITGDYRMLTYVVAAFQLDPGTTTIPMVEAALRSDLSDPQSFANTTDNAQLYALATTFNFGVDGNVKPGKTALSDAGVAKVTGDYLAHYADDDLKSDQEEADYFKSTMGRITSVDNLLDDPRLYDYVLTAYGLDPSRESRYTIRQILTADPSNPADAIRFVGNDKYKALNAAFNFTKDGKLDTPSLAQSIPDVQAMAKAYVALVKTGDITKDQAEADSRYYTDTVNTVHSVDEFLANDKLVNYALTAKGIDPKSVDTKALRKILTSDLNDPKSFANKQKDTTLRAFAAAFNFQPDGSIGVVDDTTAQSGSGVYTTNSLYVRQTMEEEAGADNAGVRLALYFERKAPTINSAFDILADPALSQVVKTALGLPADSASADVDNQAKTIEARIDFEDFKDPEKLKKFIARFSAFYDNANDTTQATALTLLSGSSTGQIGISADTLYTLAQLRAGG